MTNEFDMPDLEERVDECEQYSRRNCLVIHGVAELPQKEDCVQMAINVFEKNLGVTIPMDRIDRAHRLGKIQQRTAASVVKEGRRPIIVKFISYYDRNLVFTNKKKLKGTKLLITESLTVKRINIMTAAVSKFGRSNVYSYDGRIYVVVGKIKHTVSNINDINNLHTDPTNVLSNNYEKHSTTHIKQPVLNKQIVTRNMSN